MACWKCNQLRRDMEAHEFWEIMQDQEKIAALYESRHDSKMKNKNEKTILRTPKTNEFIAWIAYFCMKYPEIDQAFSEARTFLNIDKNIS